MLEEEESTTSVNVNSVENRHDDNDNDDSKTPQNVSPKSSSPVMSAKKLEKQHQKDKMEANRKSLNEKKESDQLKRLKFLFGQTDIFRHFVDPKKLGLSEKELEMLIPHQSGGKDGVRRHRKTEKEEDSELLHQEEESEESITTLTESPAYIKGGKMREYQLHGLNWMISLFENGINGILADEMGLGKSLQSISLLGYLKFYRNIHGPHIVIVPKSTLQNWKNEFNKWIPDFNVFILHGDKDERARLIKDVLAPGNFEVCITSFEICMIEKSALKKISWQYVLIDEAHRIKNENSLLSQIVRILDTRHRLLITGTPLQNNLHELWALLNFLLPDIFSSIDDFNSWFENGDDQDTVVKQLRKVLQPFLLRRLKNDVEHSLLPKKEINLYIGMSQMQRKWYQKLLEKDIDAINGAVGKKESKTRLLNIVMQLRKCSNHPYLFDGAEPGPPFTTDEHLVENSGKMILLDKLLKKMKEKGSRVLVFSQMSRMLDILEDYCVFRQYDYCRIDGQTAHEDRIEAIDEYNKPNSKKFVFLLTTRAGGLGINLYTADIVVLYDSDWNPQVDLQAQDRAHRIGQTKQVYVFRLTTENSIEEKVIERAVQKLRLDQLVIQQGKHNNQSHQLAPNELLEMIRHGATEHLSSNLESSVTDEAIEDILQRGEEKTMELKKKYAKAGLDDLQKFNSESMNSYEWEGENYSNKQKQASNLFWLQPVKRERKVNYAVDDYYRDALNISSRGPVNRAPRAAKQVAQYDFQFFPARLWELQEKENLYLRKTLGYQVPKREGLETSEDAEAERKLEQEKIDNAVPLTEDEEAEKEVLSKEGFENWSKRDFTVFIKACEKYGRLAYEDIAADLENKTAQEVKSYSDVFWKNHAVVADSEKFLANIERGEAKLKKIQEVEDALSTKISRYNDPISDLKLNYGQSKGKQFTEEEDRFMLVYLEKYGYSRDDVYDLIRYHIRQSDLFRFDWFIKSRSSTEISRRCQTLISVIQRELEQEKTKENSGASRKKRSSFVGSASAESLTKKTKA